MASLDISGFTSYFELLTGFYILLGLREQVIPALAGANWLTKALDRPKRTTLTKGTLKLFTSEAEAEANLIAFFKDKCTPFLPLNLYLSHIGSSWRLFLENRRRLMPGKLYIKCVTYELVLGEVGFIDEECPLDAKVAKYMTRGFVDLVNGMYIYFGMLSFIILLLSGFITYCEKSILYQVINVFSVIVLSDFIYKALRLIKSKKEVTIYRREDMLKLSIIYLFALAFYIFSPWSYNVTYEFSFDSIDLSLANFFLLVFLPLVPILAHILCIARMLRYHRLSQEYYFEIDVWIDQGIPTFD